MRIILTISIFFFAITSCAIQKEKINGLSFVASSEAVNESHTQPVVDVGANYAAVMPFGFIRNLSHPSIVHNTDRQWFGETKAGVKQYIETLRQSDIKIMIKPQIWVWRGEFTGKISMTNESDWEAFENSYSDFILTYAKLAEDMNVELLCIGTELEDFVKARPEYWKRLIDDIRNIYNGSLTYAANWDEFKRTPFWQDLDYVGIDAYFPVSEIETPSVEACKQGWQKHKALIQSISEKHDKPILFTEYGYRSMDFTGKEPWDSDHTNETLNFDGQSNATQALFETFWSEDWFAGGFIWKWFHNHEESGGDSNNQFTPQNKPVENIIRAFYSNN